jgi:hypothetical protein
MDRRSALGLLGATAAVAAAPGDLADFGRAMHRRLGASAGRLVLDPHQDATVVALTDVILPATDTPGARAARVNEFIDLLLAEWYDAEDRDRFLAGLAGVDARARAAFAKDFVAGTPQEQAALLTVLDAEAARWSARPEAARGAEPFYRRIRWLTLFGYYTSEIGAGREQHYAIIPGRYVPCAPVDTLTAPE